MNKALFLDRDGVINLDQGYVFRKNDFIPIEGICDLIKKAKENDYYVICITNQSGIARGYFSHKDFYSFMNHINEYIFRKTNYYLDGVYMCPHHPTEGNSIYTKSCNCRKPAAGLFREALRDYTIDPKKSIMIGDKHSDLLAAKQVNIETRIFYSQKKSVPQKDFIYTQQFKSHKEILNYI